MRLALFVFLAACSSNPAAPDAAQPARPTDTPPVSAAPASPPSAERRLEGQLAYTPLPQTKSVEAYLGVEFTLDTGTEKVVLDDSDAVPRARLEAAAGKRATVVCKMRPGTVPDPNESYPMNPDGTPMKRPDVCVVSSLE
jgi:hypothetical protein